MRFSASAPKLRVVQAGCSSSSHFPLEQAPDGDETVEQRHVVVVLQGDPDHDRVEQVPGIAGLNRRPATLLDAHEPSLLEQLHGLANHRPAETELLAEDRLRRQDIADRERTPDDLVRQLLDDHGRETRGPPGTPPVACDEWRGKRRTLAHANIIRPTPNGTGSQNPLA